MEKAQVHLYHFSRGCVLAIKGLYVLMEGLNNRAIENYFVIVKDTGTELCLQDLSLPCYCTAATALHSLLPSAELTQDAELNTQGKITDELPLVCMEINV